MHLIKGPCLLVWCFSLHASFYILFFLWTWSFSMPFSIMTPPHYYDVIHFSTDLDENCTIYVPEETLRKMLEICTTKTPFRNTNGNIYVQTEGVSMGNPLGPTFANFYMCNLENSVLPTFSLNWLDIIANQFNDILNLKEQFEQNSVLKFTSEIETKKSMPFLDVLIRKEYQTFPPPFM